MKISDTCLQSSVISRFLSDELSPVELTELEEHLKDCDSCRKVIERQIGDEAWWSAAEHSLRAPWPTNAHGGHRRHSDLISLLGPTDDPESMGRVGGYEVTGLLGKGGMGAVFKAFDRGLNRFVAIKMLLPHHAESELSRHRFAREGQAAAAVVDDHVLPIYAVDGWQGVPYLVMQYVRGQTLQQRIDRHGSLTTEEILRIGMQTAKGLAAAHSQGLVHRDVKPSNILLHGAVDRAMLTDFGLARATDDATMTRTGMVAGTPQFMSPEQARAEATDQRSDLFSLGAVLYAMCTGVPPFRAETTLGVLRLVSEQTPVQIESLNPDMPRWLCAIVRKLMSKDSKDRFRSASEVADILEGCLAHLRQPQLTPLPKSLSTLHAPSRKRNVRKAYWATTVCLVIAAAWFGLQAAFPSPQETEVVADNPNTDDVLAQDDRASTPTHVSESEIALGEDALAARKALQTQQSSLAWMKKFKMQVNYGYDHFETGASESMEEFISVDGPRMAVRTTHTWDDKPANFPGNTTNLDLDDGESFLSRTTSIGQKKITGGITVRNRQEKRWRMLEAGGEFALEGHFWGNQGKTVAEMLLEAENPRVAKEKVGNHDCLRISVENEWGLMTVWIDEASTRKLRKMSCRKERQNRYSNSRFNEHRDTTRYESCSMEVTDLTYIKIDGTEVASAGTIRTEYVQNGGNSVVGSYRIKRSNIDISPVFEPSEFDPGFDEGARISDWDSTDRDAAFYWQGGKLVKSNKR